MVPPWKTPQPDALRSKGPLVQVTAGLPASWRLWLPALSPSPPWVCKGGLIPNLLAPCPALCPAALPGKPACLCVRAVQVSGWHSHRGSPYAHGPTLDVARRACLRCSWRARPAATAEQRRCCRRSRCASSRASGWRLLGPMARASPR